VNRIKIWSPRWHDRVVLIACHKVKEDNEIVFTKTPSLSLVYCVKGEVIKKYPVESNGTIDCYAVPLKVITKKEGEARELSDCCNATISFDVCLNCGRHLK
jgi:hypothetical protein